ncbi:cellulose synthase [Pandoraea capi]|nr:MULTISPECIES: cellulose synthase [Pandoraea]MCI3206463.1 cellulose synthase [Pandoraea sp. LA3]MDN4584491.1 cellulose synthase [Pandoraea capi]
MQPYGDGTRPSTPVKKQKLTILSVVRREGISSKTGRPYDMRTAQCVLWQATPEGDRAVVGTVPLPDVAKESSKGEYFAEMAMAQSMDGSLVPRIVALQPYVSSTRPTATAKASAAAAA